MNTVDDWLASLGLGEYAARFAANAIDLSVVGDLTEQDLKDLDIPLGHRRKLLRAIAENSHRAPPAAPADAPDTGAQRRQLTVMFCDLVGSTELSARLDPEDMSAVIEAYQACVTEIVGRHHGMVARYMGDGALIYFGYPRAHEDDVEQAVKAGLALAEAAPRLRTKSGTPLQVCVGIATGTVVVGELLTAESGLREHTVVGETPNLAARLQAAARPGTVYVCVNTQRLAAGYFEFRDLGNVALKGWAAPMRIWQAIDSRGVENRFEAQHHAKLPPLLGRSEEIELLTRRWRAVREGEGRAVLLTGEAGIGKSHVALAFDQLLHADPHVTLNFHCSAHHTHSALFPFINQLERAAGFERGDSPAQKFARLEQTVGGASPERLALLGSLLSLPSDPRYPAPALSPQRQRAATLAAISAHFDELASRQPLVLIFEDVHWIDPTSLELLAMTVERLAGVPVFLIMTARPEFTPPWPGHAHATTVHLTRLSRRDGAALITRVAGGKTLPEEVQLQILARTDGVPLFVEELTRTVLESGQLQEQNGQYVLGQPLPSLAIPTTLHASLMARLDRLSSVREVAQIGAVIGRDFSYEVLSAVAGLPKTRLEDALEQLVQAELIFRRGTIPEAVYSFKHALVRDAAYEGLLRSRRAQLHAALAGVLAEKFPEVADAEPETLAHHLAEAGLTEQAVRYWLRAGGNAAQRSANVEAIAHLQKGLAALRSLAPSAQRDRTELDLMMTLGPCLIATQGPAGPDAMAAFAHARELCERIGNPPEYLQVMFWLTTASVMRGELPLARQTIEPVMEHAQARGDRPALLNATRGKAMILMFMGDIAEAGEVIARAFQVFEDSGDEDRLAARAAGQDAGVADLALMSWTLWLLGRPDTAVARIEAALKRADALAHPHSQAYALYYAAVIRALRGESALARAAAERCVTLAETHGFRQWHSLARAVRGICSAPAGAADGLDEVGAALEEYRHAGYQVGITALYVLLAPVLLARGQSADALAIIERGLAAVAEKSERVFAAELLRLKAEALMRVDGSAQPQADALLAQALATARAQSARSLELRIARDLARSWSAQGRRKEARDVLAPVCAWFGEGAGTPNLQQARALLGAV